MNIKFIKYLTITLLLSSSVVIGQTSYKADTQQSIMTWKGFKPTGEHYGTVKLKEGTFLIKDNHITGGEFNIDMTSIVNLDMPADNEYNAKLVKHLKSEDFFGVEKHPVAHFKITSTKIKGNETHLKGELTIKGKTNPVSFLATVDQNGKQVKIKSESFKIDRSKWDIKYKSNSFFSDLADNFIYDDIEMSIDMIANQ